MNDVRRLWGGAVFDHPVFGADAALVADDARAAAARKLMQDVFTCAEQRGMDVYFADDVDTLSANPQELILKLPPTARFSTSAQMPGFTSQDAGGTWLADPDTPEGYDYYRTQIDSLLTAYPQITCLVLWFRTGNTPWTERKVAEMPEAWQQQYQAETAKTPAAAELWHAPQMFAIGKIVRACDRALRELGHERVRLASGSWDFKFLAPCHRFFPPHVKLIGLDYNILHDKPQLADDESRRVIREVAAQRPVIPVIAFHQTQDAFQRSQTALQAADFAGARAAIAECHPESVIEQFAEFSALGGITRGEQGLVVSQNLRWLTYFVRQRQLLGLAAVRCNFAPTSHDPLAQSRGTFTFHFDADHHVWETWGAQETGADIWTLPDGCPLKRPGETSRICEEICRTGLETDKPTCYLRSAGEPDCHVDTGNRQSAVVRDHLGANAVDNGELAVQVADGRHQQVCA